MAEVTCQSSRKLPHRSGQFIGMLERVEAHGNLCASLEMLESGSGTVKDKLAERFACLAG